MSMHTDKARAKARQMGGYAGRTDATDLWDLSKRELVEIALRLGEMCCDNGSPEAAVIRVREEHEILRMNGIL